MAAVARGVGEERDRLQEAIRARAVRLTGRAAVEVPQRQLVESRLRFEVDDLRLAAQVRDGLVTVEPDVLELVFHPAPSWFSDQQKRAHDSLVVRPQCLRARLRRQALGA